MLHRSVFVKPAVPFPKLQLHHSTMGRNIDK